MVRHRKGIPVTPVNIRVEMARYQLSREDVCQWIGMNPNALTQFANGDRRMAFWAAHNIGYAINCELDRDIFEVDDSLGPMRAPKGGSQRTSVLLDAKELAKAERAEAAEQAAEQAIAAEDARLAAERLAQPTPAEQSFEDRARRAGYFVRRALPTRRIIV